MHLLHLQSSMSVTSPYSFDILIAGAGPAGCACALALGKAGLKVALADKATFPRDKVCGDAIPGRAIATLAAIDRGYADEFMAFAQKLETRHTRLWYKSKHITIDWVRPAFTSPRMAFDNFLLELVKTHTNTTVFTSTEINKYEANNIGYKIFTKDTSLSFEAKLVIGADGAHSITAKQLGQHVVDKAHYAGSVRAYYDQVTGLQPDTTYIYFIPQYLPGYLWVFPLPGNVANVGFGMLSSEISKRRLNLKAALDDCIALVPELKDNFLHASRIDKPEGFGLPFGSAMGSASGERFLLAGDAASLIDPLSGDGIGNAMLSGKMAANHAIDAFMNNSFSHSFLASYDKQLQQRLKKEFQRHYFAQKILYRYPALLDMLFAAGQSKLVKKLIRKM